MARVRIEPGSRVARFEESLRPCRTLGELGQLDLFCNNAGVVTPRLPVCEQPAEDWRWPLDVNLLGVVKGIRAFVPHLIAQGSGHVVKRSSIAGVAPISGGGNGAHAASKNAVVGLSETLVEELATVGVDVGVTSRCSALVWGPLGYATRSETGPPDLA